MNSNLARIVLIAAGAMVAGGSASAQVELNGAGRMMQSTIKDRIRTKEKDRWPAPIPGYTAGVRFIPGSGYDGCGSPVIIVNGGACYLPGYYAGMSHYGPYDSYGSNGSYGYSSGLNVNTQFGGIGLGYRQNNASFRSNSYRVVNPAGGFSREEVQQYRETNGIEQTRRAPAKSATNDYYLHQKPSALSRNPGLAAAVKDIETAFRSGDLASLERHIDPNSVLTLQVKGTTRQDLAARDYLAMTTDALKVMKTARYELTKAEPASNGAMMVTGTHQLATETGEQKAFKVGFVLKQRGERWLITEVSAEPIQ